MTQLSVEVLQNIIRNVCGIGWMDPTSEWGKSPPSDGAIPKVNVAGTGFFVAPHLVVTARHIVDTLVRKRGIPFSEIVLVVVDFEGVGRWKYMRDFLGRSVISPSKDDPNVTAPNSDYAVLILDKERINQDPWHPEGLQAAPLDSVVVSQPVVVSGYYMAQLLLTGTGLASARVGPIALFGHVAAVSPFGLTGFRGVQEYAIDVTAAGGLSGAPVIQTSTGLVMGMVRGGAERQVPLGAEGEHRVASIPMNLAFALPITPTFIAQLTANDYQAMLKPRKTASNPNGVSNL